MGGSESKQQLEERQCGLGARRQEISECDGNPGFRLGLVAGLCTLLQGAMQHPRVHCCGSKEHLTPCHPMLGHAMPSNPNPSLPSLLESCCQGHLQSASCTPCQECMDNAALSKLQGLGADGRPSRRMKGRIQCSSGVCRSVKGCRVDVWGSGSIWGSSACRNKVRAAPAQHPCTCLQQTCCSQWDFVMV